MYNESILFMSAFGQPVNMAYADAEVNEKFKDLYGSNTVAVAPWNSATPLSGELMQASLDALLQNDKNLLSAYPDAYLKPLYDGEANNVQKIIYTPIGDGQSVASGTSEGGNSVTLSAEFGTLAGTVSAAMIGATIPAGPFERGKGWNYGVFGVKNGAPTWFNYDIDKLAISNPGLTVIENQYGPYIDDSTKSISNADYILANTAGMSHSATDKCFELCNKPYVLVNGSWKIGDLISINGVVRNLRVFAGEGPTYPEVTKETPITMAFYSGANTYDNSIPNQYYSVFVNGSVDDAQISTQGSDLTHHNLHIDLLVRINSAFSGSIGIKPQGQYAYSFWVIGTTYDLNTAGKNPEDDTSLLMNFKTSDSYKTHIGTYNFE